MYSVFSGKSRDRVRGASETTSVTIAWNCALRLSIPAMGVAPFYTVGGEVENGDEKAVQSEVQSAGGDRVDPRREDAEPVGIIVQGCRCRELRPRLKYRR